MDKTGEQQTESLTNMITELKLQVDSLTAVLQETRGDLGALEYAISHDLRAPLRNIYGFAHLLGKKYRERMEGQGLEYLEMIMSGVERMGRMIDGLLNLSRIGRTELRTEEVDLSALAVSILDKLRESQPGRKCHIIIAPGIRAMGDPQLLLTILQHLLENAWKFTGTEESAEIEFGRKHEGDKTIYFIRDNGAGFAMDQSYRLFNPFQRLHLESEFAGIGVGLAVAKRALQRLGGQITAEGAEGAGATFSFTLGNMQS